MSDPDDHAMGTEGAHDRASEIEGSASSSDRKIGLPQQLSLRTHVREGRSIRNAFQDGDPWFVAADVCRGIGLRSDRGSYGHHLEKLDPDEKRQLGSDGAPAITPTLGLNIGVGGETGRDADDPSSDLGPDTWLVSESGLYTLILRSRAATTPGTFAHRFRRWVTH